MFRARRGFYNAAMRCSPCAALAAVVALSAMPARAEPTDARHPEAAAAALSAAELAGLDACGLEDPEIAAAAGPVPAKPGSGSIRFDDAPPAVRRVRPAGVLASAGSQGAHGGALAGKTVYVSPGHGWAHYVDLGWRTQRGNTNSIVEDFVSAEAVGYYLVRHLRNMGAHVVPVREIDPNPNLSIVDDADPGFAVEGVSVAQGGAGYARIPTPVTGQENPFLSGTDRVLTTSAEATGEVSWTFDVPETGAYNVYVGYVQDPSRAGDAHYVVRHAGGETHFRVDQRRHGQTWVWLGRFFFEAGTSPALGSVALLDDSATPGATLSADVARIGGGTSVIARGGGATGFPMFETAARYYAQLAGAPSSVWDNAGADNNDDVGTRSRFAAWDHEAGEDAVYIAWHTNAPNPGRGTSAYAYSPNPPNAPLSAFTGVPGSLELMDAVHDEILGDLRAAWDAGWSDRGQHTAYFGEVNPNHNPEMPSVLFEIAFHDTPADAAELREPRFRYLATRAMAQGVARYFAQRDGQALVLPPEPPSAPRFVQGDGGLVVAWDPPAIDAAGGDAPTAYRVYLSQDGYAFDDGREVAGTELAIDDAGGAPLYARVTAVNEGGESFASEVVGARRAPGGQAQVLVVNGYTRLAGSQLLSSDYSGNGIGVVQRGLVDRINDGSYVARYGAALEGAGISFDSAHADAVAAGLVALDGYDAVFWGLGEESSGDAPLDAAERPLLDAYLAAGGKLWVSGSEMAWALGEQGTPEEQAFLRDVLHVSFGADDADTYAIAATPGGLFDGLAALSFADLGPGGYDAEYPDVLLPAADGAEALAYGGGTGGAAAVWWQDPASGAAVLVFGFPFEVVEGAEPRTALVERIADGFGLEADPVGPGGGGGGGGNGGPGAVPDLVGGCSTGSGAPGGAIAWIAALALVARRRRRR